MRPSDQKILDRLYNQFKKAAKEMVGFPASLLFNYSRLFRFLKFHVNNIGDPFSPGGHYRMNTLEIERAVLLHFAQLFHAPKNNFWGYVTNGGTEGNLYGLFVAREMYPDGIVYYSDQTHYSVPKVLHLLKMQAIKIKSDSQGEIDYCVLRNALNLRKPIILLANIGTTMKGAVDDIVKMKGILTDLKVKKYYIHCDAAFFGMILPFLPEVEVQPFDFRVGIDSIAISGHKMIGTPIPCGVVLCKRSNMKNLGSYVEYTGIKDNTITGSRNGITPLFLWQELHCVEESKFSKVVQECINLAGYAIQKFNDYGIHAWRNKNSIIVVFPKPSMFLVRKWQLAVEGDISHFIALPHLTRKIIDRFIKEFVVDLKQRC